jgi:hypothetical protein
MDVCFGVSEGITAGKVFGSPLKRGEFDWNLSSELREL